MEPGKGKGVASPMYARVFYISLYLFYLHFVGSPACYHAPPLPNTPLTSTSRFCSFSGMQRHCRVLLTVARRQSSLLRLCIETPREGMELQQPGHENIISLSMKCPHLIESQVTLLFLPSGLCAILQCVFSKGYLMDSQTIRFVKSKYKI